MENVRRTARLLASVTNETEALLCAHLAADIIDAKNPAAGALGALPHATVKAIRARVPRHIPVSATIGDPADDVDATARAAVAMAGAGADIVKVGLSARSGAVRTLERLAKLDLGEVLLVGVLLADQGVELDLVGLAHEAGFAGLMLDTADKKRGALPDIVPAEIADRRLSQLLTVPACSPALPDRCAPSMCRRYCNLPRTFSASAVACAVVVTGRPR